jgi:hypothetical protein
MYFRAGPRSPATDPTLLEDLLHYYTHQQLLDLMNLVERLGAKLDRGAAGATRASISMTLSNGAPHEDEPPPASST